MLLPELTQYFLGNNSQLSTFIKNRKCSQIGIVILIDLENCRYPYRMTPTVHALPMPGQFMIFSPNVSIVNEQKAEIFILLLNSEFSAQNRCPIANKKSMK